MKKTLCVLLCALMLLGIMAPAMAEEHGPYWIGDYTLTWWIPIDSTAAQYMESYAEHPFVQWMKEQTGVSIDFIHYSYEQREQQFNLMVVSNNYYDLLYGPWYPDGPQQAVLDGVYADIYEFEDLMPHYFEAVRCSDASFAAWEWGPEKELYYQGAQPAFVDLLTTVQGNMWTVSEIWTDSLSMECGPLIRKDWLDEAGLDVPETIDELAVVLEAFKARGEDVIPMSLGESGMNGSTGFLQNAFDFYYNWYFVKDGVVQPGDACGLPQLKAYLELMSDWYAKGYIDPDFMNRDYDGVTALLLSDRLGIFAETWSSPEYFESLYEGEQNFDLVAMPMSRMSKDQTLHFRQAYGSENSNNSCIYAGSELKEIAARYLDVLFTKEAILRGQYGVEGESYELDENGVPYFTQWFYDHLQTDKLQYTYLKPGAICGYWSTRANLLAGLEGDTSVEAQKTKASDWSKASAIWAQNADTDFIIGYVTFDGDGWGQMYDPFVEADTYYAAQVLRMITGTEPIENFEADSQKAWDMGMEISRTRMQESYNRQHGLPEDYGMDYEFGQ